MSTGSERELTCGYVRFAGRGPRSRSRWLSARLVLATAAVLLLGWPVPALASQSAFQARPSLGPDGFDPCPHGAIMRAYQHFRVFACNNGPSALIDIKIARADLNSLWGPETQLMGNPLSDYSLPNEDGRIDFYLVTGGQTLSRGTYTGSKAINLAKHSALGEAPWDAITGTVSSGFVVALRPESLPKDDSFTSVLAHELFHVLQFAHNTTLSCPTFWFTEASAKWAEWYFVPRAAGHMVYPWFREFGVKPDMSLTDPGPEGLHAYAAWMWPLFMQQQAGGSPDPIALAWKTMDGLQGCNALNANVSLEDSFNENFRDFAVENFDYRLPNLINHERSWPVNFKANYLHFRQTANPSAPSFPEELPHYQSVALNQTNYPYTATVKVDLPPLSAQYRQIPLVRPNGVGGGGSVEFDFSGLAPVGFVDVSLLAADGQQKGLATNNGTWQRIDLGARAAHAKICLDADAKKRDRPLWGVFYVIIDNHSEGPSATPVTGSYTVTQRTTCAAGLSGQLQVDSTLIQTSGSKLHQTVTLNLSLASAPTWPLVTDWSLVPGKNTWSEQYKMTQPCVGESGPGITTTVANGSGPISSIYDILTPFRIASGPWDTYLYMQTYSVRPAIDGGLLALENATGTASGCGSAVSTAVPMGIGIGCPVTYPSVPNSFNGRYTAADAGIDFNCSGSRSKSGVTYTVNMSGTLTATDPVECGLWTPKCSIGASAPRKSRYEVFSPAAPRRA